MLSLVFSVYYDLFDAVELDRSQYRAYIYIRYFAYVRFEYGARSSRIIQEFWQDILHLNI